MSLYQCPYCHFAAVNGEPVRRNDGLVLKTFTDKQGQTLTLSPASANNPKMYATLKELLDTQKGEGLILDEI